MSNLPPYSTFRTDMKQELMFPQALSNGNVVTFTIPGFHQSLNVKFPDSRLPVCESCKKNFKTRDMCRVRNQHTAPPWTTAYICMTIDESCTDENGRWYVDKPMVARMVQWQPFCSQRDLDPKTPVCASCKKTNRTRSFCRERHRHRHLPWCTVYMLLSTEESVDPATIVAAAGSLVGARSPIGGDGGIRHQQLGGRNNDDDDDGNNDASTESPVGYQGETSLTAELMLDGVKSENVSQGDGTGKQRRISSSKKNVEVAEGDDINDIADSRTMLVQVSTRSTSITWLETLDIDDSPVGLNLGTALSEHSQYHYSSGVSASAAVGGGVNVTSNIATLPPPPQADPNIAYHYPLPYAQHQGALKTQQQQYFYQLQQRPPNPYAPPPPPSPWTYGSSHPPPPHGYGHALPPQTPQQHQQQSPASPVSAETPSPAPPVTAGEAAAQLQKKNLQISSEDNSDTHSPTPPPLPTGIVHYQHHPHLPPETVAQVSPMVGTTHMTAGVHPQQQQFPWMMYQQMYQAQIPLAYPQAAAAAATTAPVQEQQYPVLHAAVSAASETPTSEQGNSDHDRTMPPHDVSHDYSSEGNEGTTQLLQHGGVVDEDDESDNKRRRLV